MPHWYTTCRKTRHSYMTCLIGIRYASRQEEWHKASYTTCLIQVSCDWAMRVMKRIHEWHNSFVYDMPQSRVMWFVHVCDVTHSRAIWRIHTCDITHSLMHLYSYLKKQNGVWAISVGSLFLSTHLHACRCICVWMSHDTHLIELYLHSYIW